MIENKFATAIVLREFYRLMPSFSTHGYQTSFLTDFNDFSKSTSKYLKNAIPTKFKEVIDDFKNAQKFGYFYITLLDYFDCYDNKYFNDKQKLRNNAIVKAFKSSDSSNTDKLELWIGETTFVKHFEQCYHIPYNREKDLIIYEFIMFLLSNMNLEKLYKQGIKTFS